MAPAGGNDAQPTGERRSVFRGGLHLRERLGPGVEHGLISAATGVLAYLPTQALGLREGFWSAITAISVAQTEFEAARTTARDQFTGAAVGGLFALAAVLTMGQDVVSYAVTVILAMAMCWLLNVASAARLAGVTATIVLLVPHEGSVERMMISRVAEVAWGVTIAVIVVWTITKMIGLLSRR